MQTLLLQSVSDEKSTKLQDLLTPQHRVVCTGCNLRATSERQRYSLGVTPQHIIRKHILSSNTVFLEKKIYIHIGPQVLLL